MINRKSIFDKDWISKDNPNGLDASEFVDLAWDESERRMTHTRFAGHS